MATQTTTRKRNTPVNGSKISSPENIENPVIIPGEDEIRNLAEVIYHQRLINGEPGTALEDWLMAESYLRSTDN